MKRNKKKYILVLTAVGILMSTACRRVPDHIIQPGEMSALLADIHVGEAVVEQNRRYYAADSMKMVLKQSILERHGTDPQQFDSSLSWYAHNPELYLEVYDHAVEILQKRMNENDAQIAQSSLSVAGDSVDLWANSRYLSVSTLSPVKIVTFNIEADENSNPGDRYTWRARFVNNMPKARWGIAATYTDGTVESFDTEASNEGWNEIEFISDSTLQPKAVYGYLKLEPRAGIPQWIDSIQLVRNRLSSGVYGHRYRQKSYRR